MADNAHEQVSRAYFSGLEVPVDHPPQRVVSLVPSLTESLFDLDLGDRLIAVSADCIYPADKVGSLLHVGGTRSPDMTRIIELQPDLVLFSQEENRPTDAEALQAAHIPVWITNVRSVFDTLNVLWNLMDVFDHPAMIPRVREIERAYDYALGASRAQTPVRVFVPLSRDPWTTFNADTYAHDVLRVCGGENVFGGKTTCYPPVTLADVIEAQPEMVLLAGGPYPFSEPDAALFRTLDIPAAYNGQIVLIDGTLLTWHGTRVAFALRDLPVLFLKGEE